MPLHLLIVNASHPQLNATIAVRFYFQHLFDSLCKESDLHKLPESGCFHTLISNQLMFQQFDIEQSNNQLQLLHKTTNKYDWD